MKKYIAWLLVLLLTLSLTACSEKETSVYVQKVSDLIQMGGIGTIDRFSGIVVSESVTEIKRDSDKTIASLLVKQGDDVAEGQPLFSYDTEELQLTLDKQRLELEQLESSIENYTAQIEQLEKDRERASSGDKLEYTLQIQTNQIDLKEAELNLKTKQSEIQKSEYLLSNAVVVSPVAGRITSISEDSASDTSKPYITVQNTSSYRVKGVLNELQRGSIMEGDTVRMESRLDPAECWTGTVTLVDYENPTQDNGSQYYSGNSDEMTSSSRYPFYVELDSFEGLLLGQHVYITVDDGEENPALEGVLLSSSFLCYAEDGGAYVWADNGHGKLEKRTVELGEYDMSSDRYQIVSGLTEEDFVAFPEEELCKEGAPTTRTSTEGGVN